MSKQQPGTMKQSLQNGKLYEALLDYNFYNKFSGDEIFQVIKELAFVLETNHKKDYKEDYKEVISNLWYEF